MSILTTECSDCKDCKLCKTRRRIVWGEGPAYAKVMFIGEGPGEMEDVHGTPFYHKAPAGQEMDRLLATIGLNRENVYITNTVKCRPPNNRDPQPDEVAACKKHLLMEIQAVKPKVIVAVGASSTRNLLGPVDMEAVHGIPFRVIVPEIDFETVVVPSYHPAAGLRSPDYALRCVMDFQGVSATLRGAITPAHYLDPLAGSETYGVIKSPQDLYDYVGGAQLIALDTETLDFKYTPYMVSISVAPGTGMVIYTTDQVTLTALADLLGRPNIITLIHNSLFDLFVLDRLRIFPSKVWDTMIMAYLLQSEPQGLKPLAFRYWGMKMKDYDDMVALASADLAEWYLRLILTYDWPDPEKILQIKPGGKMHYKQPQNIAKVVARIFSDYSKNKIGREDFWRRWHKLDFEGTGRDVVEAALGEMPRGNLSMVEESEAVWYSARDADATIRIFPQLWSRIQDVGMTGTFDLDMGIIPMVKDMMENGIMPDVEELIRLGDMFGRMMKEIEEFAHAMTGEVFNLGSPMQVAEILYEKLSIQAPFKHGQVSTDDKTLARIVGEHPVVPLIRQWRGLSKLKGTYADTLPKQLGTDGRVHTTIKITRTATGRLASANPNLMNIPTRTQEGKAIRKAFRASEGSLFVSNDLSGIEMRVLAHETGDPRLVKIFTDGLDLHSMTASGIFKLPIEELDEMAHRYPAKRVGFGVVYGITADGLREQLLMIGLDPMYWTTARCQQLIDDWFELYADVEVYMHDLLAFALRHGYVVDMFGRRRYLATIRSSSRRARADAARQAGNMPIQSGAAGIFKKGMKELIPIYKDFQAQGYRCHPIIPIHDDLVFEVSEEIIELWVPIIQDIMEHSVTLKVPILSEAKVGKVWGAQEKYTW